MTDIGFIMINIDNNVEDSIFKTIQQIESNNPYKQTIIFNSYCNKINTYNLPILHISQAQFFTGVLFLFDLASVLLTNNFPNIKKRILYINNTPWSSGLTSYSEWESLFNQESLELLTANQELYDIYEICWKKPLGISKGFNYEDISPFIQ